MMRVRTSKNCQRKEVPQNDVLKTHTQPEFLSPGLTGEKIVVLV